MSQTKASASSDAQADCRGEVQVVPRAYAGKWVAWSADGRRIVAVGNTFRACQQAAIHAGFPVDQIAIERVPTSRPRLTGSGM
jgi:hypothetical protein